MKNKKGAMAVTAAIATIIVVGVMLFVAIKLNSEVGGNINRSGFSAAENTTYSNVSTSVLDSIELSTVVLTVLIAAIIIGVLLTFGRA